MYSIGNNIILRTPRFGFDLFLAEGEIKDKIKTPLFKEALYLASPTISGILSNKDDTPAPTLITLIKYFSRACFRCTPFGLFAGISTVTFGKETNIIFTDEKRCTRLDMDYLCKLSTHLTNTFSANNIKFYPNNSLYHVAGKVRYIEFLERTGKRHYHLSEVTHSKELGKVLEWSENGSTRSNLIKGLVDLDSGISEEEAVEFIQSLIANQLLFSELEPALTGEDILLQLLRTIDRAQTKEAIRPTQILKKVDYLLKQLDAKSSNDVLEYRNILTALNNLKIDYDENKVFQVDLIKSTAENTLDDSFKKKLHEGIKALSQLASPSSNTNLDRFKNRFQDRYENREVSLLEVLDSEIGLGYPDLIEGGDTELTNGIHLPDTKTDAIKSSPKSQWLLKKLQLALFHNQYSIDLEKEDLSNFKPSLDQMPHSFSAFFKIVDFKNKVIQIESVGGSSSIAVLGRFAHLDKSISGMAQSAANSERESNPNVIFAEIVHLPESRLGNIILHPPFYNYEIPYLAKSSLPLEHQIPLKDLYVSIEKNAIKLFSKRLNKEIIPRLSNAHNFALSELPVYQFLCDLQSQNNAGSLTFNWGPLAAKAIFLPRVTYNTTILHLATWNLNRVDYEIFFKKTGENQEQQCIQEFRCRWKIPRYVALVEGDNELFIDFENSYTIAAFLQISQRKDNITLREFLFDSNTPIKDTIGNKYINQFVASFIRDQPAANVIPTLKHTPSTTKITRTFPPGSEWLYYKYYCGVNTSDEILINRIKPLTRKLLNEKLIDSWFFVRYKDSHSHLRIRLHLKHKKHIGKVLDIHNKFGDKLLKSKLLWRIQVDTYEREIERYGDNAIEHIEKIFFHDSLAILTFLYTPTMGSKTETRWLWGIYAIDALMGNFEFSLAKKAQLMEGLKTTFAAEFKLDKSATFEVDKKYRKYKTNIESVLNGHYRKTPYEKAIQLRSENIAALIDDLMMMDKKNVLYVSIEELVQSCIHMFLNRLIPNAQRFHEMIIYDFMYRYYASQMARLPKLP